MKCVNNQVVKSKIFTGMFVFALVITAIGCTKDETESETRSYSFKVSRNNSALANSIVSIETRDRNFIGTTDNDGTCIIKILNSIDLPLFTVVTVDHGSIMPYCLTVPGTSNSMSSKSINCKNAPTIIRLKAVSLNHLGDDRYEGAANSQLQLPSEGIEKSFKYNLPAVPGIMPRMQIYAKGIQNPVEIFFNGVKTASLGNSDLDGDLSLYDFQLNGNAKSIYKSGINVLTIKTGKTVNSSDVWDDIEFCGIMLYYN